MLISDGNWEALEWLLLRVSRNSIDMQMAFEWACGYGRLEVFELQRLLDVCPDINIQANHFYGAFSEGNWDTAVWLIEKGGWGPPKRGPWGRLYVKTRRTCLLRALKSIIVLTIWVRKSFASFMPSGPRGFPVSV